MLEIRLKDNGINTFDIDLGEVAILTVKGVCTILFSNIKSVSGIARSNIKKIASVNT